MFKSAVEIKNEANSTDYEEFLKVAMKRLQKQKGLH